MNKEEAISLGVPEEKYRDFQILYNRDMNCRLAKVRAEESPNWQILSAIDAMLKLIKRPETLYKILKYINYAYYQEV